MAEKKEINNKRKEFVWLGLRIGFWVMVAFLVISVIYGIINPTLSNTPLLLIISGIMDISIIFTFVVSIVHLTRYKEKALAIVALVISSILVLWIILALILGFGSTV